MNKFLLSWLGCACFMISLAHAADNWGEGPLSVRNQFPLGLRFISMTPDSPATLDSGDIRLSAQLAIANTFINTRGQSGDLNTDLVRRGLNKEDFYIKSIQQPHNGFNLYLDLETYRQQYGYAIGGLWQTELGVTFVLNSLKEGRMDLPIEWIHQLTGVDNHAENGGFRAKGDRNRFDYYVIRNDEFIFKERKAQALLAEDPVFWLKWRVYDGAKWIPAIALKTEIKLPWTNHPSAAQNLVSSGGTDQNYSLLFSKTLWPDLVYGYLQYGLSVLGRPGENFRDKLRHLLGGMEIRTQNYSWIAQVMHQTSLFPGSSKPIETSFREKVIDRGLAKPTDVLTVGIKQRAHPWQFYGGFSEDINQTRNETDFVVFMGLEWVSSAK